MDDDRAPAGDPRPIDPVVVRPRAPACGLKGLCPRCGSATLFAGHARFAETCSVCGLRFADFNVGDGPAAFLTLIWGTIVVVLAIVLELRVSPPWWVHILLWLPLTTVGVVYSLRIAKGWLMALEYRNRAREGADHLMSAARRGWPLVPTIVVALAVAAMIALGLWQLLDRLPKKEAYLAQLAANPARPPIAFPRFPDETLLFRRASAFCLEPVSIERAGAGAAGFRLIASCRTGTEGPGFKVQLGTTHDPEAKVAWTGGRVSGWISHAPDARPLIATLVEKKPQELLLVAETPLAGLHPNKQPDLSLVPNNHLAYGGQWFLFAAVAAIIYVVAVRRRMRG